MLNLKKTTLALASIGTLILPAALIADTQNSRTIGANSNKTINTPNNDAGTAPGGTPDLNGGTGTQGTTGRIGGTTGSLNDSPSVDKTSQGKTRSNSRSRQKNRDARTGTTDRATDSKSLGTQRGTDGSIGTGGMGGTTGTMGTGTGAGTGTGMGGSGSGTGAGGGAAGGGR